MSNDFSRFQNLKFEDFKRLAKDEKLSHYEKIGFPVEYRKGNGEIIFNDILYKLSNLSKENQTVLDIGPGCSTIPRLLINLCKQKGNKLLLIDSQEMLDHLPDDVFITKIIGYYPDDCKRIFKEYTEKVNVLLVYSVIQYVFTEGNLFDFLDRSLMLLDDGGEMLIGDIPNISKRKRFFNSTNGIVFHQNFTKTKETPEITYNVIEEGKIDDAIVISIVSRCRSQGFDAYLLPQADNLPMANRREDILIKKP